MNREQLVAQIRAKKSFLCVGLDTDMQKLPSCILAGEGGTADKMLRFNKAIIDATAPYCVAYKPNVAFYEAFGLEGMKAFEQTVAYLKANYPDHMVIADAKRGDIGNTSAMYARTFFGLYDVDALTVAPYMGEDSVTPFLGHEGKWVILLAMTSNKGGRDFQFFEDDMGQELWVKVMRKSKEWADENSIMFVVGATRGDMFEDVRKVAPRHFLLVPGIGAQGGSLEEVCKYGMTDDCGLIVNSSRGIIYASSGDDFAQVAAEKAQELQQQMAALLPW